VHRSSIGLLILMLGGCGPSQKPSSTAAKRVTAAPSSSGPACRSTVRRVSAPGRGALHPQIGAAADAFAVAWEESRDHRVVQLQSFGSDAQPLGPAVAAGARDGAEPRVAPFGDGGFAVFWSTDHQDRDAIVMRRFDRAGKPVADAVPAVVAPGARALSVAPVEGGFALAWWNWNGLPHQISVSYVDKQGRALGRPLPVTRAPSPDPTVDVWPGGAVGSKALGVIAWEEVVDGLEHIVVGDLGRDGLQGRVDRGAGETPELGHQLVVFERSVEQRIYAVRTDGTVVSVDEGHVPAAAPRGPDASALCFLRDTDPSEEVHIDELWCGTLGPDRLRFATRVAIAPRGIFALQLAVAGSRVGVVWQTQEDDDTAVFVASLSCPDGAAAKAPR
jgi:hypothetical protein